MPSWLEGAARPDPGNADEHGLVAVGGRLEPDTLLGAYRVGVFPWSSQPVITWWSPDPRAIFDLATFRSHRSVGRSARRGGWTFSVDRDFEGVMRGCAESAPGREETWISEDFVAAYGALHRRGFAHSVEVWDAEGRLVGGIYGVSIGGFFGGESMFHRTTDASKAAVGHLVELLREGGYVLFDAQVWNPHLERLGAIEIPRREYMKRLEAALKVKASLPGARRGSSPR
jgi:leucyl/phenylalanyl-tRNA--protein transferase